MLAALRATLFLVAYLLLIRAAARPDSTSTPAQSASSTLDCVRFHKTGFWDIDIANGPDLPPECGPPLSFNAIRDKSKLPAEICAVVGAYLFVVLALGTLLLTWGRRMRQSALGSNGTLEIEMVNSPKKQFEPSPVSPASTSRSWIKKGVSSLKSLGGNSTRNSKAGSTPASPGIASINSVDANVVQDDRERAQKEMERLYAAVMAHEDAKKSQSQVQDVETAQSTAMPDQGQKPKMRVNVSETRVVIPQGPQTGNSQVSEPTSPRSPVRAIYPPDHKWPQNYPVTPTSPIVARVPLENDMYPASPPPKSPPRMTFPGNSPTEQNPPASPRSLLRRKERPGSGGSSSVASGGSKTRKSLRNIRISQPIPQDTVEIEEREPLTPRQYPDPGKPPQPPTPHTGNTQDSNQSSDDYQYESLDQPAPLPNPQPQRKPSNLALSNNNSSTSVSSNGNSANGNGTKSTTSSTNALPLRAFAQSSSITSPGPMKTTFLERRADHVGRGPMTGRTPRTGVPMTPYSPYMPYTPITPVTPRLVSKRERKEMKKAVGKKVIIEEDAVKDQEEMWDM